MINLSMCISYTGKNVESEIHIAYAVRGQITLGVYARTTRMWTVADIPKRASGRRISKIAFLGFSNRVFRFCKNNLTPCLRIFILSNDTGHTIRRPFPFVRHLPHPQEVISPNNIPFFGGFFLAWVSIQNYPWPCSLFAIVQTVTRTATRNILPCANHVPVDNWPLCPTYLSANTWNVQRVRRQTVQPRMPRFDTVNLLSRDIISWKPLQEPQNRTH